MRQFFIERASAADAEEAFRLIEEYCTEIGVFVRDCREDLEHYLVDEQSGIWLAWPDNLRHKGKAVGCVLLRPLPHIATVGEIKRMYVRKAYRELGIAKEMLLALEQYAREHGMNWLYLDTKEDLKAAVRFYEQSGYRRCERYNENPQATIFMRKQLRDGR